MRRVFDLDVLRCPRCAGRMQLIATIDDPAVMQKILAHLGLPGARVTHLCLVSPAGFPTRGAVDRPTRSYREAGDDEARFREICRHNLLVNMLNDPASVTEEAVDIQAEGVRRARFNSRKVSGGGTLLDDLAHLTCRIRVLWGERDDSAFRPAEV